MKTPTLCLAILLSFSAIALSPSASAWGCENFANGYPRAACEAATGTPEALVNEVEEDVQGARCRVDPEQC